MVVYHQRQSSTGLLLRGQVWIVRRDLGDRSVVVATRHPIHERSLRNR